MCGAGQGRQFIVGEMAKWPSIRPAVGLELFRENADNHAEIGCRVFLPDPFDHSRPVRFEVLTQLSEEILT